MDASYIVVRSSLGTLLQNWQELFVDHAVLYSLSLTVQSHNQDLQVFVRVSVSQISHLQEEKLLPGHDQKYW